MDHEIEEIDINQPDWADGSPIGDPIGDQGAGGRRASTRSDRAPEVYDADDTVTPFGDSLEYR